MTARYQGSPPGPIVVGVRGPQPPGPGPLRGPSSAVTPTGSGGIVALKGVNVARRGVVGIGPKAPPGEIAAPDPYDAPREMVPKWDIAAEMGVQPAPKKPKPARWKGRVEGDTYVEERSLEEKRRASRESMRRLRARRREAAMKDD